MKKRIFKKYKNNFLLLYGFLFSILGVILNIYFDINDATESSRVGFYNNFFVNFIIAVFLIPPIEELIFRGLFYRNKFKWFLYFGSFLFILYSKNFYLLFILFLIVSIIEVKSITEKLRTVLLYFLVTLLFSLVHYKLSDFNSVSTIIPALVQFGVGLILIWFTINLGLKTSIALHALYNFFFLSVAFLILQFNTKNISYHHEGYELTLEQVSIFNNDVSFEWNNGLPSAKNMTLEEFYSSICKENVLKFKDKSNKKYNIRIQEKSKKVNKIDCNTLQGLLQNAAVTNDL